MATLEDFENTSEAHVEPCSTLGEWYAAIRTLQIDSLTDGDIARCIRQKVALNPILQNALRRLSDNPLAGDQYDGELMASLSQVSPLEWTSAGITLSDALTLWEMLMGRLPELDVESGIMSDARQVEALLRRAQNK